MFFFKKASMQKLCKWKDCKTFPSLEREGDRKAANVVRCRCESEDSQVGKNGSATQLTNYHFKLFRRPGYHLQEIHTDFDSVDQQPARTRLYPCSARILNGFSGLCNLFRLQGCRNEAECIFVNVKRARREKVYKRKACSTFPSLEDHILIQCTMSNLQVCFSQKSAF